jgi:DNA-binding NtrC family response regulator
MQTFKVSNQSVKAQLMKGYLTIQLQTLRRTFEINEFVVVGRSADSETEMAVHDHFISNQHCRIEKRKDDFWVRDLRSRNGTFVNGTRISEALLRDGDQLRVGETEMIFTLERNGDGSDLLLSSKNKNWQAQLDRLPLISRADLPVLVFGPSGSGKEIMARALHQFSHRAHGPFVSVNCSALTESLVESELFGHIKGSFTGAADDRKGAFISAKGGTLFLDEIGDLPPVLQPKLLRALENQEIKPVGSDRPVSINVRIISATHKDLGDMVRKGGFREDLFFRLNVLRMAVPSLHQRQEDFEDLIGLFGRRMRVSFSTEAIRRLKGYGWPGQVRELKNFVARASALFPSQELDGEMADSLFDMRATKGLSTVTTAKQKMQSFEVAMIKEKLVLNRGHIRNTAKALGLPKSTLYDRMKSYGIDVHQVLAESYFATPAAEEKPNDLSP